MDASQTRTPRRSATLLALSSCLALGACSGAPEDATAGGVQAVTLWPMKPPPPLGDARFEELAIPAGIAPWRVQAGSYEVVEDAGGSAAGRRLTVRGREAKRIEIPGPFSADRFNRVAFQALVYDVTGLQVELVREGRTVLYSEAAGLIYSDVPQPVALDFPHVRAQREPFDALVISIRGKGHATVGGIVLHHRPLESWLPRAGGEPALIAVGEEARRARALTSEIPWSGTLRAPRGGMLTLSYGVPHLLRYPGADPAVLRITVGHGRRAAIVRTLPLADPPGEARWHSERIDVGPFAGKEVELRAELLAPGPDIALCALGEARLYVPRARAPAVLLVSSDTHRADYLGLAGRGIDVRTPALDALAERGVWFEDCLVTTNVTNPSHIALMTARHPRDFGILDNARALSSAAHTLADAFRAAGYRTFAAVSTRHLGDEVSGLGQGFDRMSWPLQSGARPAGETVSLALRWSEEATDAPLFLWVHTFDAHSPYAPPEEFAALYYDPARDPYDATLAPSESLDPRVLPQFLAGLRDPEYPEAMYRGEISYLDRELGRLFDHPRLADAIVAFTADHGECLGHHGIHYTHADLYPSTIHVPLILSWPGAPRGARVAAPVQQLDLGRTLLDLAGLDAADFPGQSLLAAIEGHAPHDPRFAIAANHCSASITWRGWHLILHLARHQERSRAAVAERHEVELYHVAEDPGCLVNRLEDEPELARSMRERLLRWLGDARDLGWALDRSEDPTLLAELAGLGYADGGASSLADYFEPDCRCAWCRRFE